MTEQYVRPENLVPTDVFIGSLVQTGGDVDAMHSQFPGLSTTFVGEFTTAAHIPPTAEEPPMPYSAKSSEDSVEVKPGDVVRARGSFEVQKDGNDGYQLAFRSGVHGDTFLLQELDKATAEAFTAYGPTYTEVDMQVGEPHQDSCCHSTRHASLKFVVGVQEPLSALKPFTPEEMVLIDGRVVGYAAGNPDERPAVGRVALADHTSGPGYRSLAPRTYVKVMLANGQVVELVSPNNDDLRYRPEVEVSAPDKPMLGDGVRILAGYGRPNRYDETAYYQLLPLTLQLQTASPERAASNDEWERSIQSQIDSLGSNGSESLAAELSGLLETAFYREGGHHLKLRLSNGQKRAIVEKAKSACADAPDSLPIAVTALKDSGTLLSALYAMQEGTPIATMTAEEFKSAVETAIATRPEYSRETELTYTLRLFGELFPADVRTEVCRRAWQRFKDEEGVSQVVLRQRVRSMQEVTDDIISVEGASLWGEVLRTSDLGSRYAFEFLRDAIFALDASRKTEEIGETELKVLGVYHDTMEALEAAYAVNADVSERQPYTVQGAREAFDRFAARCYVAARKQGLIP